MTEDEIIAWLQRHQLPPPPRQRRIPIDEVLAKNGKIKGDVASRIRRLNPNGYYPGNRIRGWNPHPRINKLNMDVIGPKDFIARFGRQAYRSVPKTAFYRQGHRKALPYSWVMNNMTALPN